MKKLLSSTSLKRKKKRFTAEIEENFMRSWSRCLIREYPGTDLLTDSTVLINLSN